MSIECHCGGVRIEVSVKTLHCSLSLAAGRSAVDLWLIHSLVPGFVLAAPAMLFLDCALEDGLGHSVVVDYMGIPDKLAALDNVEG